MFEKTHADGIMIGRAALGNPWIFKKIIYFLEHGEKMPEPSNEEKYNVIKEHFELLLKYKGEYTATREIRKHIGWYVKGMPNASEFRDKINKVESEKDFSSSVRDSTESLFNSFDFSSVSELEEF